MGPRRVNLSCHLLMAASVLWVSCSLPWSVAAADDSPTNIVPVERPTVTEDVTNSLGSWIWMATTLDRQTCQFWRSFEIAASNPVVHARILMTVDNEYNLLLDGRELGRGS